MSDLIRTIIKWIIVIILTILLIGLLIHLFNGGSKKNSQPVNSVENIKLDDDYTTIDIAQNSNQEDEQKSNTDSNSQDSLVVHVGETGAVQGISVWIGTITLCFSTYYVYRMKKGSE